MNSSTDSTGTPPGRRSLNTAVGIVALVLVVALVWWLSSGTDETQTAPPAASTSATASPGESSTTVTSSRITTSRATSAPARTGQVPQRVTQTLALIDAGDWPEAANAPGTQGGRTFGNREGLLPKTGAHGQRLRFQEWDVNPKKPNRGRDAERIITADDGSAWYTLDHYRTFIKIRGPSQ